MSPKPPDILRKSHRHTERKQRATAKEDLRQEIPDAVDELDDEAEGQKAENEKHDRDNERS
ncbi:MAG: hypothetical protein GWN29_07895 [Gammaproteobacteria bacterium]|nr:hypothetical protein [Gammaproteobacteria bacterium]